MKWFFLLLTFTPLVLFAQDRALLTRTYTRGDHYRYRLSCISYQNGQWTSTTVSVAELKVIDDGSGVPYDEIRWLSSLQMTPKDTTDETSLAVSVEPYRISLDPRGKVPLPSLTVAGMTEPITDLNTFFVAISPALGALTLKKTGDSFASPIKAIGDFSNGKNILKGQDCLQTTVRVTGKNDSDVFVETSFLPPAVTRLKFILPEMETPVIRDTTNNFQMVMPAGPDKFNVQYGREFFYIHSRVRGADGKLLGADMSNSLTLKLKINCDKDYQHCAFEMPMSIQRKLVLELLEQTPATVEVPRSSKLLQHFYGKGVQVYVCAPMPGDTSRCVWTFKEARASLYTAADYGQPAGKHYFNDEHQPVWEAPDGSKVVGKKLRQADAPGPKDIPWLLLQAVSLPDSGPFRGTGLIQRINTQGGKAPMSGADRQHNGQTVEVGYTAEYLFYSSN